MFADDTSLVCLARTEKGLLELSKQSLDRVSTWMRVNKLQVHPAKSSFIIFSRTATYYPWISRLKYSYGEIERKSCVKYLGITLDETLSFRKHVGNTSAILSRNIGILRKLAHFVPHRILRLLYFSIIHPYILYCSSVWLGTFPSLVNPIRVLQNNAIRLLCNKSYSDSVRLEYRRQKILPAAGLRDFYHQLFMFKYNNNNLPLCFSGMFKVRSDCHNYNTRTSKALSAPIAITTRSKFSFIYRGIKLWNSNDKTINDTTSFEEFRNKVREKSILIMSFKLLFVILICILFINLWISNNMIINDIKWFGKI